MQVHSLIEPSTALPARGDRVYGVGGRLLSLRLRFRANCATLQQALQILTDEDYLARYRGPATRADETFLDLLQGHCFAREFGAYFPCATALGSCIDGIVAAWKESDYLMREVGSDFSDPIFADWTTARLALAGYLTTIGRGDFLVASLLDCHNGFRSRFDETQDERDAYLKKLSDWAEI